MTVSSYVCQTRCRHRRDERELYEKFAQSLIRDAINIAAAFKLLHDRGEDAILRGEHYTATLLRLMDEAREHHDYVEDSQEIIDTLIKGYLT